MKKHEIKIAGFKNIRGVLSSYLEETKNIIFQNKMYIRNYNDKIKRKEHFCSCEIKKAKDFIEEMPEKQAILKRQLGEIDELINYLNKRIELELEFEI